MSKWNLDRGPGPVRLAAGRDWASICSGDRDLKVDDTSGLPCVFYLQSGVSLSHRKKSPNSLSTEDEDPAPALGSSSTVGYLLLDLLSFDPPLEILVFSAPSPKLLFLLDPPPEVFLLCMHGRHLSSSPRSIQHIIKSPSLCIG
ncbi:hypothetical protein F2Q70_00012855 [Brassica cretica]|uniref:Uncharacterized protein n=1 Tax=Brassica cretica TaxID=69181 RepID=A0A8S9LSA3_BRACR|nr:hypothetical protein F2Q70_00012855 [Brassica cretica]